MADYNYDKSVLSGLTTKAFMREVEERNRHIAAASDELPPRDWAVNRLARELHPHMQFAKIAQVEPYAEGVQYTLVPDAEKGTTEFALFRPGQFVAVALEIDGHPTTRTYHLCGSPKDALGPDGSYTLMVSTIPGRTACFWIHEHWQVGSDVLMSGPLGNCYPQSLRDGHRLLGIGTNGMFYAYGRAIADGLLDADLTVVYPTFALDPFIQAQEREIVKSAGGRVKIVPVLYAPPADADARGDAGTDCDADTPAAGAPPSEATANSAAGGKADGSNAADALSNFAGGAPPSNATASDTAGGKADGGFTADALADNVVRGPLSADLLREQVEGGLDGLAVFADISPFFLDEFTGALREAGIPDRRIHREYEGMFDSPAEDPAYPLDPASDSAQFTAIVHARHRRYEVPCGGTDTLLDSMEQAGISVPADCRSGRCGWCHSRLISGDVFIPESKDGRREADRKFGWIHPCSTYPLSDVELEVFPLVGGE